MKWLNRAVIGGYRPFRSLALLGGCAALALASFLCLYIEAGGNTLVTFEDVGFEFWIVLPIALVLFCAFGIASPETDESTGVGTGIMLVFSLVASLAIGQLAGYIHFGAPVGHDEAYKTRDGTIHRGYVLLSQRNMRHRMYIVLRSDTPQVIPLIRGDVELLGMRFRYVVSDEWLPRKDADLSAMLRPVVQDLFGGIAAEKSRSKRLAFLNEFLKEERKGQSRITERFCERLPAPCPFSDIDMHWANTPDVPRDHWSDRFTAREALEEQNVQVAISHLLRAKLDPAVKDAIIELVLTKGTAEHVVSILERIPLDHPQYDALVTRALSEELKDTTLMRLASGGLLHRREDRARARARMFEDVSPDVLFPEKRSRTRMTVEEVQTYGERLLSRESTVEARARFLAIYHEQIASGLAIRIVETIGDADAATLIMLLTEDFADEGLREMVFGMITKARDSAIVKLILSDGWHRRAGRDLSGSQMRQLITSFLKKAHDPRWYDAITNYVRRDAITDDQVKELVRIGLERKIPDVFRIALDPRWSSDEEAQEILRAFLGFADKYACVRALRMIAAYGRQNDARITADIRARVTECSGDQVEHLKRRL